MQSASDTSRSELESEINKYLELKKKYHILSENLEEVKKNKEAKIIEAGSLVQLKRRNELVWYLIVDRGKGLKVKTANGDLVCAISKNAPIAEGILGLSEGSKKEYSGDVIEITRIM